MKKVKVTFGIILRELSEVTFAEILFALVLAMNDVLYEKLSLGLTNAAEVKVLR